MQTTDRLMLRETLAPLTWTHDKAAPAQELRTAHAQRSPALLLTMRTLSSGLRCLNSSLLGQLWWRVRLSAVARVFSFPTKLGPHPKSGRDIPPNLVQLFMAMAMQRVKALVCSSN